jgi:clan AA aspartic protease (TIGR02281 family)
MIKKIKIIFTILILFTYNSVFGEGIISAFDFKDIYNLYFDQQYSIVKAKMLSFGYDLQSEVPQYSYNGITYLNEFVFIKTFKEFVNTEYGSTYVDRKIEFRFKAKCESAFIDSRIDYKCETTKPQHFFVNNIIDIWMKDFPSNSEINSKPFGYVKKQLMIMDTTEVCGRSDEDGVVLNCRSPKNDFRVFLEYSDEYYSKTWGFLINNQAMYPVDNIDIYLAQYKKPSNNRLVFKIKKIGQLNYFSININGNYLNYILDSGASEMSINKSTYNNLVKNGFITNANMLPPQQYTLADGSVKTYKRVIIKNIKLGSLTLNNVRAYICDDSEPMLLGQSFLNKFAVWQVNNSKNTFECVLK